MLYKIGENCGRSENGSDLLFIRLKMSGLPTFEADEIMCLFILMINYRKPFTNTYCFGNCSLD